MGNKHCTPKQAKTVCGRCIKIPYTQATQIVSCGLLRRYLPPSSSYKPGLVHFFIRTMDDAGRYVEHHWTRDGLCASHDEPMKSDKLLWHINLFESGVRMTYETIGATYKCKGPYKIMSNNCIHATNRLIKLVEEEVNHSQPPSRKSASPTFHSKSASPTFQSLSGSVSPSKRSLMSMSSKRSLTSSNRSMASRTRSRHRAASAASSKSNFTNSTTAYFRVSRNGYNPGPRYATTPEKGGGRNRRNTYTPPQSRSSMRGPDKKSKIYL